MNKASISKALIVAGVCISAAVIIGEAISSYAYVRTITSLVQPRQITVTGSAERIVKSDLAIWNGTVSRKGTAIAEKVMARIKGDIESDSSKLKAYFLAHGIKGNEIVSGPVTLSVITNRNDDGYEDVSGYVIWRKIGIRSDNPEKVAAMACDVGEILNLGVHFETEEAEYYCSRQDSLKLEMYALATQNARVLAQGLANKNGSGIRYLSEVQAGAFQLTAPDSSNPYEESASDTTSINKKAVATVIAVFEVK